MSNHLQSERSPEVSRGSRLLRMAFASLMSFAAIAGFAANASAQDAPTPAAGSATIGATITGAITLTIDDGDINFGSINPATAPASGTRVDAGNSGAYFVSPAVTITVNSNVAWTGTATRSDDPAAIETAGKIFLHQTSAPTEATQFTAAYQVGASDLPTTWELEGDLGSTEQTHYLSLYVPWNQAPGTVNTTVTYTVAAVPVE